MNKIVLTSFTITCLLSTVFLTASSVFFVLAQIEIDITYELTCEVTSNTTLWNPGTHNFEMICEGQLHAPFSETFTLQGSGTATYSCVGGGDPPCEFDLTIDFSGYLNNSFFDGPFTLSAICHGETVLIQPPTLGFIRTEEIHDLSATGTFNSFTWNLTTPTATVDFSFIDAQGKAFQFRITGTSHLSPPEDDTPPMIENVYQQPAEDNVYPDDKVEVYANVTDYMSGVKQVTLNYTNGNGTWITIDMTKLEGDVWNATIRPFPYCTYVNYTITAEDNVGNIITTEEALGYQYQYHVIPEFPSFLILPLFMIATLLAVIVYRRKHSSNMNY